VVLFNEPLPEKFQVCVDEDFPGKCDLLVISGTSLVVEPMNGLPSKVRTLQSCNELEKVRHDCARLIVNQKMVGTDVGINYADPPLQDFFFRGDCDEAFKYLADKLAWSL
jgi:NAD-dependent SIR2 family protein deacetylase